MSGIDFDNTAALEAELAAVATEAEAKTAAPKEKKPRVIKVKFVADRDIAAGEEVEFDYTMPAAAARGCVVGIALEDMTDDQLKIEHRNANSVYYKQNKAGKDTTKSKARLDACLAEMEKRGIQPNTRTAAPITPNAVADLIKSGKMTIEELQAALDAAQ